MEWLRQDGMRPSAARPRRAVGRRLGPLAALLPLGIASLMGMGLPARAGTPTPSPQARLARTDTVVAHTLADSPQGGWSSVIVRLRGDLTTAQQARLAALHADICRHLPFIQSVALRVPARNLGRLAALPFVVHVSSDGSVRKSDEFTVDSTGADVACQRYHLTGQGVTIAVVDSGISPHADLSGLLTSRVVANVSFVPGATRTTDDCGHGTHVAAIAAGDGSASSNLNDFRTFYGIARQASLVNVRVLDRNGQGTVSQVISGIQWVVSNKTKYKIRVLNLSLGHPVGESYTTDPLCQAVEAAWKAGIVVVCAAGNEGRLSPDASTPGAENEGYGTNYGSINSPGNDPYVITVGAMKSTNGSRNYDTIATYSSRGPSRVDLVLKPDIVAPGNQIISALADDSYLATAYGGTNQIPRRYYSHSLFGGKSTTYFRLSGTSMATPVVAGAAALMLQKYPALSPDTVKARLMLSADKWVGPDGAADPCTYGAGYLDIPAALASTATATQPAMSPSLSEDDAGNVYINMDRAIWGKSLWGTGLTDLRAIWGKDALWMTSDNLLSASRAIWGRSVWSDRAIWGTSYSDADLSANTINGE